MGSIFQHLKADYGLCDSLPFDNDTGSDLDGGTVQVLQDKVGILYDDVPDGETVPLVTGVPTRGVSVPRNTNDGAWSPGDSVYLDLDGSSASTGQFTTQSSTNGTTNPEVGYVYAAAASGDNRGRVVLPDWSLAT